MKKVIFSIFIISLACVSIFIYSDYKIDRDSMPATEVKSQRIMIALTNFFLDCRELPETQDHLEVLLTSNNEECWMGPYLKKIVLIDPWGTPIRYIKESGNTYSLSFAGPDKEFDTSDDIKHEGIKTEN